MKYLILLTILFSFNALADQRGEDRQGGLCHFAYDPADADNEINMSDCQVAINQYDAGDGQGRLAFMSVIATKTYNIYDGTHPVLSDFNFKGADTVGYDGHVVSANTVCTQVRSNYDANADDSAETVYVSNDWNLEFEWIEYDQESGRSVLEAALHCRYGRPQ